MDNEAVTEEEELNVLSLLATESTEEADDIDEEEVDMPEKSEELKILLERERGIKTKRNHSLRKSREANDRIQKENDELRERLNELDRRIYNNQSGAEAEKTEQQVQEWQDRVADDPTQALAYTDYQNTQLADKMANYLGKKFGELEEKLTGLKSATNPDYVKYRDQIEILRKKDAFSGLDESSLVAIAKELGGTKIRAPRGPIAGQRPRDMSPEGFEMSDEERAKMGF